MLKITEDEIIKTATATMLESINRKKLQIIKARVKELGYEYDESNIYLGIENDCETFYYSVREGPVRLVTFQPLTDSNKFMHGNIKLSFEQSYY